MERQRTPEELQTIRELDDYILGKITEHREYVAQHPEDVPGESEEIISFRDVLQGTDLQRFQDNIGELRYNTQMNYQERHDVSFLQSTTLMDYLEEIMISYLLQHPYQQISDAIIPEFHFSHNTTDEEVADNLAQRNNLNDILSLKLEALERAQSEIEHRELGGPVGQPVGQPFGQFANPVRPVHEEEDDITVVADYGGRRKSRKSRATKKSKKTKKPRKSKKTKKTRKSKKIKKNKEN